MQRSGILRSNKPIRQVSPLRKERLKEYAVKRELYLRQHPVCECCTSKPSVEIHHTRGRENERLVDEADWMAVCRPCHQWIETNRTEAYERGYLRSRHRGH